MSPLPPRAFRIEMPGGGEPDLATLIWTLDDVRAGTLRAIESVDDADLERLPPGWDNSIGTLLYHLAATELGWLYRDVLQREFDADAQALRPYPYYAEGERLFVVCGETVKQHTERLAAARALLLERYGELSSEELSRPRRRRHYETDANWVIYHLAEHEAHHRGQIASLVRLLRG